ncbi:unnamed protein product [Parnassius apollo]|uniref:(apollo) hypothetical protein n=1 Tax=Parnassius apollo TaxID=110799 RepID=A0A8S3XU71_PARAO|nr:unnamed protein product [Parnassius apollo]
MPFKDVILRAIEEISKGSKIKTTADKYKIPRSSMQRYLKQDSIKDSSHRFITSQIFTDEEEQKLSNYIIPTSTQVIPEHLERENQNEADPVNLNNIAVANSSSSFATDQITIEVAEVVTPEIVRPYPKACPRKLIKNARKKAKTRILTDTPEKRLIELAEQEKQIKNKAKKERQEKKVLKNTGKKQIPKLPSELTSNRVKKRQMSSSDSDIENVLLTDSSEGSFAEDTSEEELDEDDVIMVDRNFQKNDYVLVKFNVKKTVVHYVGQIEDISHTMATIKFMRLSKIRNTFFFPEVDDIACVLLDDIKTKLPEPKTCNKTKRGSSKYTFDKPLWVIPNLR